MAQEKNTMNILHIATKTKYMNSLENFHIYKISKEGNQLNKIYTNYSNPTCDTLIKDPYSPSTYTVQQ